MSWLTEALLANWSGNGAMGESLAAAEVFSPGRQNSQSEPYAGYQKAGPGSSDDYEVIELPGEPLPGNTALVLGLAIVLGLIIVATVIGNIFVIAAIIIDRNLRTVSNYLVLSLAVADLMVACLVMPLGAVYEVNQAWILPPALCDAWTSIDVLCCTSSILHLLAIAVDRYWAVTSIDYMRTRDASKVGTMIAVVWLASLVVSIAPILGWKDPEFYNRVLVGKKCLVSQDALYQIFATFSSFYVPLFLILLLYWKIFKVARQRIRHKPGKNQKHSSDKGHKEKRPDKKAHNSTVKGNGQQKSPQQQLYKSNSPAVLIIQKDASTSSQNEQTVVYPSVTVDHGSPGHDPPPTPTIPQEIVSQVSQQLQQQLQQQQQPQQQEPPVQKQEQQHIQMVNITPQSDTPNGLAETQIQISVASGPPAELAGPVVRADSETPMSQMSPPPPTAEKTVATVTLAGSESAVASSNSHGGHSIGRLLVLTRREKSKRDPRGKGATEESIESRRERKARKTVAIITGVFVACWLPFFSTALLMAVCEACIPHDLVLSLFLWLGYVNSMLNPIIYTIFSPDFRNAFNKILHGKC